MKRVLLAASLAVLCSSAFAADLPTKAPGYAPAPVASPAWAGWTLSGFGGWGQNSEKTTITGTEPIGAAAVSTGFVPSTQDPHPNGGFFGAELGYNWQLGAFVAGVAGDFRFANIDGKASQSHNINPLIPGFNLNTETTAKMDWMASVVGRFGILLTERALLSIKGGVAFADIERTTTVSLATPIPGIGGSAVGKNSGTQTGWILGADLRVALPANWYAEVGYEFASFDSNSRALTLPIGPTRVGFAATDKDEYHFVRAGIGYRF